ncbi:MAG: hypothetical protein WC565_01410 [Parcubacteria group bacterium]
MKEQQLKYRTTIVLFPGCRSSVLISALAKVKGLVLKPIKSEGPFNRLTFHWKNKPYTIDFLSVTLKDANKFPHILKGGYDKLGETIPDIFSIVARIHSRADFRRRCRWFDPQEEIFPGKFIGLSDLKTNIFFFEDGRDLSRRNIQTFFRRLNEHLYKQEKESG